MSLFHGRMAPYLEEDGSGLPFMLNKLYWVLIWYSISQGLDGQTSAKTTWYSSVTIKGRSRLITIADILRYSVERKW